jgi:tetratricopeptide (TPR) repeat protein
MDRHISKDEILRLFSYGPTAAEVDRGVAHLAGCPMCWTVALEAVTSLKRTDDLVPRKRGRPPELRFRDVRDALIALMEIQEQRSIRWLRAKGWWAELKDLNPREQAEKVSSVAAIRQREFVETIFREAKLVCGKDPYSGEHLAMTAHALIDHLPGGEFPAHVKAGLHVSAMTVVANSRRLAGNWRGSSEAVCSARSYLSEAKIEPVAEAYLLSVHASLLCDTGHLEEAVLLVTRAADIYRSAGDLKGLATMKIQAAGAFQGASKPSEAILMAEEALSLLTPGYIRLEMLARSIITESLVALGRLPEALKSYEAAKPLYDEIGGELMLFKAEYLEAKILDALGYAHESEKLFRSAIDGATDMENYRLSFSFRFAFFESLFKRDALVKAAQLCQEGLDLLQTIEGVHPQMHQVWRDLLAAVKVEALTETHVAEVREYLERHWALPARQPPFSGASPADI